MGLLRRRAPDSVLDTRVEVAVVPSPPSNPVEGERCRICERPIVLDAGNPSELLVAMLIERPGERPWALVHRSCVQRTRGRLPF
jgi:hypothetical protein